MPSTAASTLVKAHFFVDHAEQVASKDRDAFGHFLEAAIIFARSVTFHVQKEFGHCGGFDSWYSTWQMRLRTDPLSSFLTNQRNSTLKEGTLGVSKHVAVELNETCFVEEAVNVVVTRGLPWYRHALKDSGSGFLF
jgi:hypothetical protein